MTLEEAKDLIGKKVSVIYEKHFMTIKNVRQFQDMILATFEENNYTCNIEVLKYEDGSRVVKL